MNIDSYDEIDGRTRLGGGRMDVLAIVENVIITLNGLRTRNRSKLDVVRRLGVSLWTRSWYFLYSPWTWGVLDQDFSAGSIITWTKKRLIC